MAPARAIRENPAMPCRSPTPPKTPAGCGMRGAGRNRRSPVACRATAGSAPGCRSKSRSARRTGLPPSSRSATAIPSPDPTRRPRTNGTASPRRWRCHATGPKRDSACGPDQPREPDCAACRQRAGCRRQPRTAPPRRSARISAAADAQHRHAYAMACCSVRAAAAGVTAAGSSNCQASS